MYTVTLSIGLLRQPSQLLPHDATVAYEVSIVHSLFTCAKRMGLKLQTLNSATRLQANALLLLQAFSNISGSCLDIVLTKVKSKEY